MKHFEWNAKLATGYSMIDEQHQQLFRLGEAIFDNIATGSSREYSIQAIKEMTSYAAKHFREEEELMRRLQFPQFEMHKRLHEDFRKQLVEYIHSLQLGVVPLGSRIAVFLEDWILHHIMEQDQKMVVWIKEHPPST